MKNKDRSSSSESPKSSSSEAIKASVAVQKSKVFKAETIQKKIYGCADGDSTRIFKFFDGSYVYETLVNDQVMNWNAGRYDIQRSTLLMLPLYYGVLVRCSPIPWAPTIRLRRTMARA